MAKWLAAGVFLAALDAASFLLLPAWVAVGAVVGLLVGVIVVLLRQERLITREPPLYPAWQYSPDPQLGGGRHRRRDVEIRTRVLDPAAD